MAEYQHPIEIHGRYQLVAVTHEPVYSPGDVFTYRIVTGAGARVTEDLSLERARSELDALLGQGGEAVKRESSPREAATTKVVESKIAARRRRR